MKKPELTERTLFTESYIDQYCRSVEFLLNRINDKSNIKSSRKPHVEELFEHDTGLDLDLLEDY